MKGFFQEFRSFAVKGNVMDLAIAVIIGTAFNKIVSSLVDSLIMPVISIFIGGIDFSGRVISVGKITLKYGVFLQSIADFVIIAFVIFMVVKAMNRFKREPEAVLEKPKESSEEAKLLSEIRDLLRSR